MVLSAFIKSVMSLAQHKAGTVNSGKHNFSLIFKLLKLFFLNICCYVYTPMNVEVVTLTFVDVPTTRK